MRLSPKTIVGVYCSDPALPGRMYLSRNGGLTKDLDQAQMVEEGVVDLAIKEVKAYSDNVFTIEAIETY